MTKVLLVEDDNNLREIYEARLAAEGYDISTAKDGEDALAVAKQVKPDLIISDVMMPRISGFEMLDILRNTDGLKHTKVIMLTALGQAEDKTRADSLGADRYLVKSQVTLEDIVKAADELLNPDAASDSTAAAAVPPAMDTTAPAADTFSPIASPGVAAAAHQTAPMENTLVPPPSPSDPASNPTATPPVTTQLAPTPEPSQPIAVVSAPTTDDAVPTTTIPAPTPEPAPDDTSTQDNEPLIQMPPQPVSTETATATATQAQSTSQENDAVSQQIENFVNTAPATTPAAEPAAQASTAPTTADDISNDTAGNDAVIKEAIDNLATDQSVSTQPVDVQPVTPVSDTTTDDVAQATSDTPTAEPSVNQISGKKVISPINDINADNNDLQTLLAQEEMKENLKKGTTGTPVVGDTTAPQTPPAADTSAPAPTTPSTKAPVTPPDGVFVPNKDGNANENAL